MNDEDIAKALSLEDELNQLPPIQPVHEFFESCTEEPEELIQGLVCKGDKMLLGGSSKSYKSWTLLDLACCMAKGEPFWGLVTRQSRVLYINLEIPEARFKQRLGVMLHPDKPTATLGGYLHAWNLRGKVMSGPLMIAAFKRFTEGQNYDMIILDPLYKISAGLDENAAGDMSTVFNELERLTRASGAALVIAHHFTKGNQAGKEAIDRFSGSGVFARDADVLITTTKHALEDCFTIDIVNRNFPPISSFVVRWEFPRMCVDNVLNPQELKRPGSPKKYDEREVLQILEATPLTSGEWRSKCLTELHMSDSTFNRFRRDFLTCGFVRRRKDQKYELDPETAEKLLNKARS